MSTHRSPVLRLDGAGKVFPGKTAPALEDVSTTIAPGEFVAVIGRSGAGKTTLLRCVSRATGVTRGAIRFGDTDLATLRGPGLRAYRSLVGMIYQQFNVVRRLSVMDNVLVGRLGHLRGWARWAALAYRFDRGQRAIALRCLVHVGMLDRAWQRARVDEGRVRSGGHAGLYPCGCARCHAQAVCTIVSRSDSRGVQSRAARAFVTAA